MATDPDDVLSQLQKAKAFAVAAIKLDEAHNMIEAMEQYDKAILFIDEVTVKLPPQCEAQAALATLRAKYDTRLEKLREMELNQRGQPPVKIKRRMSKVPFNDSNDPFITNVPMREDPPDALARRPYWLLRLIYTVITEGGYLTPRIYFPKMVWAQFGVKFSGLAAKTSAFANLMVLVTTRIYPAELPTDIDTARAAAAVLQMLYRDMVELQNNLAKPFPFIREIEVADEVPKHPPKSQVGRLSNIVSSTVKSVVKYAEASYQRLGAALPSHIPDDEFADYATLAAELCNKCQALDSWHAYVLGELHLASEISAAVDETEEAYSESTANAKALVNALKMVESELCKISAFMRDVVCEILLRDCEYLLTRYMRKTRKSFSRMYWDDENTESSNNFNYTSDDG